MSRTYAKGASYCSMRQAGVCHSYDSATCCSSLLKTRTCQLSMHSIARVASFTDLHTTCHAVKACKRYLWPPLRAQPWPNVSSCPAVSDPLQGETSQHADSSEHAVGQSTWLLAHQPEQLCHAVAAPVPVSSHNGDFSTCMGAKTNLELGQG